LEKIFLEDTQCIFLLITENNTNTSEVDSFYDSHVLPTVNVKAQKTSSIEQHDVLCSRVCFLIKAFFIPNLMGFVCTHDL
jgi:hypothetical protein